MQDKIALVTGGTGGIGSAICKSLATQGARVIASYNRNGDHKAAEKWQKAQDYEVAISYVDVTDFNSCANMVRQVEQGFGRIDILVNNAGISRDVQLRNMDLEQWRSVMQTNLDGVFNITRQVINGMIDRSYGRIINISSINGQKGQFGQANYSAAKAGIHGFTKTLAQEVAKKGITVNTISPGYIDTKKVVTLPENKLQDIIAQIPVGRLGKPEEVARAVAFLAAGDSSFITGANFVVNGGQYLV